MIAGAGVNAGGAGMLRTRRRDVSVKPNRKLDRKSSRGMIYENEELRLRTIHINAEVEQGQNDIKKLRRENEQLRREIWSLRDEYDKLEEILKKQKSRSGSEEYEDRSDEDDGLQSELSCEEDEELEEEEDNDMETEELNKEEQLENAENQKISSEKMSSSNLHRLHVDFDDLSVVDEEEELKKDRDRKEGTSSEENQQQKEEVRSPPSILRPRQLHENIPFYPATYEPSNTFSSSSYYTECPFEFPSTADLMLPADTPALLASPCSRLHTDPLIPLTNLDPPGLDQVADQILPQLHVPPVGWQSNVLVPQKQLPNYPTASVTSATAAPKGIQMYGISDPHARQETQQDQRFGSLNGNTGFPWVRSTLPRRDNAQRPPVNIFNGNPFKNLGIPYSNSERMVTDNGWSFDVNTANERNVRKTECNLKNSEGRNTEGVFMFDGSEKPKHFFAPLPSKIKKQTEEGSPTTSSSHFGTGNSSSSGKTGSTVILKSQYMDQKGSADIYVNGAVPYEDNVHGEKSEQRTFLSTDNLLIAEDKVGASTPITKSFSCQDLTSDFQNAIMSKQLKMNPSEHKQFTQSDNTLDNISNASSSKPYTSHLSVTLKMPRVNETSSLGTPEIPKLPSIDYKLFKNPFLRNFEQTRRDYADQDATVTKPLSVQVNDDNVYYRCPSPPDVTAYNRGLQLDERYRTLHGPSTQNRLLIPSNQLIDGKILSPMNKHEIQVTSFERPSPHTLIPAMSPYELNPSRKINGNPYLQNRSLYQNIPFLARGPGHVCPQSGAMRMYYDHLTMKVPAQTQTSMDVESQREDDRRDEDSPSVPNSPSGQRRKKTIKKEKCASTTTTTTTTSSTKEQKPLSPAAQRRLKKQSSVTSSETPDSPGKLARKRPRKLSVTTTTTSDAPEDKNESRSSSSGQDSPRKEHTRRVSLYFNAKKRPSLTSVKTTRSGSIDTTKDKALDGLTNSDRERTNSISSRETTSVKARKASTSSGSVPWCACWGNGCF